SSLRVAHRVRQLTGIENVRHNDLGAARLQRSAAQVECAHHGAYRNALGEKLTDDRATGFSGRAGYQNFGINHRRQFNQRYGNVPMTSHGTNSYRSQVKNV